MHTITITADSFEPVTPNESEVRLAGSTSERLAAILKKNSSSSIQVLGKGQEEERLDLPESAARILVSALEEIAKGRSITLVAMEEEITTGQAADLLSVSRPYFVQMLDQGEMPFRKVGPRRRVKLQDVMTYKRELYSRRLQTLDALTAYDQELGVQ